MEVSEFVSVSYTCRRARTAAAVCWVLSFLRWRINNFFIIIHLLRPPDEKKTKTKKKFEAEEGEVTLQLTSLA